MNRLFTLVRYDILFQFRHGFYLAYGFVTLFYLLFLRAVPENFAQAIFPFILFTDISILGFFFVGGVVLLEKGQNALDAILVTPVTVTEYLLSKVISLSVISTAATLILFLAVSKEYSFLPVLLLLVWTNMFLYTLLGIALVSRVKTVTHYFVLGVPAGMILFLPLLTYFDLIAFPPLYLLPTEPTLEMLNGTFTPAGVVVTALWCCAAWRISYGQFDKYIARKGV